MPRFTSFLPPPLAPPTPDGVGEYPSHELLILPRKYFPVITLCWTGYLSLQWRIAMGPAMGTRRSGSRPFCQCITTTNGSEQNEPYHSNPHEIQNGYLGCHWRNERYWPRIH